MGIEVLKGDNPGLYSKSKILKVTIEVCPNLQYPDDLLLPARF